MIQREKKNIVRVGYVGLGSRGYYMLLHCFVKMTDVEITWVCDLDPAKVERAEELLVSVGRPAPKSTLDYREMLTDPDVDAVINMTGWDGHVSISLDSLRAGKYTAVEVGCAYDISECYALVDAYESTGAPLMMLENCCYGRREMMALRMVREGLFGEIVHCDGGYMHYLNHEDLFYVKDGQKLPRNYRVQDYQYRNCEQYPTHELGPISKILGINRGNRMLTISSFASKSRGLKDFVGKHLDPDHPMQKADFKQGDIITSVITCAGGETIRLTLDTTLPRPYYSRNFCVRGTHGCCIEEMGGATFFLEGMPEPTFHNEVEFYKTYDHPLHAEYSQIDALGGHGGIDWLVCRAFIESVKAGTDTPIDAYDTAAWMAIAPLSEASIAKGGAPVEIPDFTRGRWFRREPALSCKYGLDTVFEDKETPVVPQ